jgi:hypothetical protein
MNITWLGSIIEAIKTMKRIPLPLNRIFEKANAAIEDDSIATNTAAAVTTNELMMERNMPVREKSFSYALNVGSLGNHSMGTANNAPLLFKEVEIIHRNGTTAIIPRRTASR